MRERGIYKLSDEKRGIFERGESSIDEVKRVSIDIIDSGNFEVSQRCIERR